MKRYNVKSVILFLSYCYLFIAALLLISCSRQKEAPKNHTLDISDNIMKIHNHFPLYEESKIKLEFTRKIGEYNSDDPRYIFYDPEDLTIDSNGNLYVLDLQGCCVKIYTKDGKYIKEIGRKGQGPTEFRRPTVIDIDNDNQIYVGDPILSRLFYVITFDFNGNEIRRFKLPPLNDSFWINRKYNEIISTALIQDEFLENLVSRYSLSGEFTSSFGKPMTNSTFDVLFSNSANDYYSTFDNDGNIVLSFKHQNRIEKYSHDGKLQWTAWRDLNYPIEYNEKIVTFKAAGQEITSKHPDFTLVSSRSIGVDKENRIWVATCKKQPEERQPDEDKQPKTEYIELEVYDKDGILLDRIPLPQSGNVFVFAENLYILDDQNEYCIYQYSIIDI